METNIVSIRDIRHITEKVIHVKFKDGILLSEEEHDELRKRLAKDKHLLSSEWLWSMSNHVSEAVKGIAEMKFRIAVIGTDSITIHRKVNHHIKDIIRERKKK